MDPDITADKIESLHRCLRRLEHKRPARLEELQANLDLQDILALNLERAVQLAVDLAAMRLAELDARAPQTMGESFAILAEAGLLSNQTAERMQKAVGFRNIAVHSYRDLDWSIVFAIVHKRLADFDTFISEIEGQPGAGS
ncbi:MAG TPA: DUF86 domain-containing protein [Verrucomicrobiota bacterium]|nr:DUF86 domain-containing protein [Verrucomicrobiota bacterium]HQF60736.1 DUF86 domain-containing protein [Verrucomicrobiota bacterium]HQK01824.1 DUF86 domain-containing protein [Verrucomicrobiota bacterium]